MARKAVTGEACMHALYLVFGSPSFVRLEGDAVAYRELRASWWPGV